MNVPLAALVALLALLRAGGDVVVVAGLLGHSSLDTTRTYTGPTDRDLAAAVEAGAVEY